MRRGTDSSPPRIRARISLSTTPQSRVTATSHSPRARRSSTRPPRVPRAPRRRTSYRWPVNTGAGARRTRGARRLLAKGLAMRGQMLWFNEVKDHGFIMTDEGERLEVQGDGFSKGVRPVGRCAHMIVSFEVDESGDIRRAHNVVFEEDAAPRRARLRSGGRGVRR